MCTFEQIHPCRLTPATQSLHEVLCTSSTLFAYRYDLAKLQIMNQITPQPAEQLGAAGNGNLLLLHDHQDLTLVHIKLDFLSSVSLWGGTCS